MARESIEYRYTGNEYFPNDISVNESLESIAGGTINGLDVEGTYSDANPTTAKQLVSQAEYTIKKTYAEKTGYLDDLALSAGKVEYVNDYPDSFGWH
ncbi:hypothetical protein PF005_g7164 [Phytophthora fragariae]|uniref:Uncharacterized protein n=1 Tax=Phytophthora fragariae TaxID=53985 RepID=A0A6A4F661_9STRA|nr:hypothetical protein PF003_g28587 [Phytophthora fragariae]KAE8942453.1 hypothetical protein PF009_g7798 [Phytophthora fragariae]KAE9019301.1 hypothetical protein PF011_g5900 [Phytophthora fragariae]KAE9127243.1 hypothetical protein PF007_g5683 [Phytophthora fragariae]KAE9127657.1 hypothetical protein PF010_g4803 [Phytophthora fragariae]